MNYFGMFFSFMIPGIIVGAMLATVIINATVSRRVRNRRHRSYEA